MPFTLNGTLAEDQPGIAKALKPLRTREENRMASSIETKLYHRGICTEVDRALYWLSAIYEAGKCIVGLAQGRKIEFAASGEDGGFTDFREPSQEPYEDTLGDAEADLVLLVSGELAEDLDERWQQTGSFASLEEDEHEPSRISSVYRREGIDGYSPEAEQAVAQAEAIAWAVNGATVRRVSEVAILDELLRAEEIAEQILLRNWDKVQRLAEALCAGGRTGSEIRRLIGQVSRADHQ
jgi:hypothetical protein